MKKLFSIVLTLAAVLFVAASCNDIKGGDAVEMAGEGSLSITITQDGPATKAGPSVTALAYEQKLNRLDYFLFEGGTTLYNKKSVSSGISGTSHTETFNRLPVGNYTVIVVANAPAAVSSATSLADLKAAAVTLANCSRTESEGFIMYAEKTGVAVSGGQTTDLSGNSAMSLERFPARVRLVSVENKIPTVAAYANSNAISVKGVFLTNVYSTWRLDGTGNPSAVTNAKGRKGSNKIAAASQLDYGQTGWFPSSATTVANSGTTVATLNWDTYGFPTTAAIDGSPLRLVILATVNGTDYYYPVKLIDASASPARAGIERNKTYEVSVAIYGTGSDDPDVDVVRGNISASVTVKAWVAGASYSEEI